MVAGTGKTIYETILSLDLDNNPVTGATFDIYVYKDGNEFSGVTPSISLIDGVRGVYSLSWSSDTIGEYQLYIKNNNTSIIFVSDNVSIKSDSDISTDFYIGL